jgi:hypothetical protein
VHQRLPYLGIRDPGLGIRKVRDSPKQKAFDGTATWDAMTQEARGEDARIVDDK